LPLADSTSVSIHSTWDSPSFIGGHLPETRDVRADGFDATWRISNLGRDLPSRWTSESYQYQQAERSSFGVGLFVPVGMYQLADRATKYAVLIIGLTFVGYFLFEVISRLHLHPLQYLLVGFANTLFYLLLLSFSEHIGFGWAYLVSSVASTMLIGGYSGSILGSRRRAVVIVGMLAGLYGFLYLTLNAENYALLAGSLGLWVILGLVMYLTRGIDWHNWGNDGNNDEESDQVEMFAGQSG
jgi:inner membrane protein